MFYRYILTFPHFYRKIVKSQNHISREPFNLSSQISALFKAECLKFTENIIRSSFMHNIHFIFNICFIDRFYAKYFTAFLSQKNPIPCTKICISPRVFSQFSSTRAFYNRYGLEILEYCLISGEKRKKFLHF